MIWLIAANTFRETIRQRFALLAAIVALALTAASKYFLRLDLGHDQLKFVFDFASGAMNFFGIVIATSASCSILAAESENKTVITLLSKSVNAADFAFGKALGVCMALAIFALAIFAAACASLIISKADMPDGNPAYVNYAGVFAYCFVQWLKLCMCVAMSVAVCSLSRSFLFAVSVSFLCIFCAVLSEALTGMGGSSWAAKITSYALPDFRYLESSRIMAFAPIDFKMLLNMGAYSAVYIVCALALAAWFYSRRDF